MAESEEVVDLVKSPQASAKVNQEAVIVVNKIESVEPLVRHLMENHNFGVGQLSFEQVVQLQDTSVNKNFALSVLDRTLTTIERVSNTHSKYFIFIYKN